MGNQAFTLRLQGQKPFIHTLWNDKTFIWIRRDRLLYRSVIPLVFPMYNAEESPADLSGE